MNKMLFMALALLALAAACGSGNVRGTTKPVAFTCKSESDKPRGRCQLSDSGKEINAEFERQS